jgi:hypothetical protein
VPQWCFRGRDRTSNRTSLTGRVRRSPALAQANKPFQGDRSMARTSSLAWLLLGLCLSRPTLAHEPASISRATTPQVHQTVYSDIKYLKYHVNGGAIQRESRSRRCCHSIGQMPRVRRSETVHQQGIWGPGAVHVMDLLARAAGGVEVCRSDEGGLKATPLVSTGPHFPGNERVPRNDDQRGVQGRPFEEAGEQDAAVNAVGAFADKRLAR